MRWLIIISILLSGCSAARVLVIDCQDLAGSEQKNCELVRKL